MAVILFLNMRHEIFKSKHYGLTVHYKTFAAIISKKDTFVKDANEGDNNSSKRKPISTATKITHRLAPKLMKLRKMKNNKNRKRLWWPSCFLE